MAELKEKGRSPTASGTEEAEESVSVSQKKAVRKKLYRKRTMEEVERSQRKGTDIPREPDCHGKRTESVTVSASGKNEPAVPKTVNKENGAVSGTGVKKRFRQRTMEEAKKSMKRGAELMERVEGDRQDADANTAGMAVEEMQESGRALAGHVRNYSRKLSSERTAARAERSGLLHEGSTSSDVFDYVTDAAGFGNAQDAVRMSDRLKSGQSGRPGTEGNGRKHALKGKEGEAGTEARKLQKERIKKEYAKAARETGKKTASAGGKAAGKTGEKAGEGVTSAVSAGLGWISSFMARHPLLMFVVILILILMLVGMCMTNVVGLTFSGAGTGVIATSYVSEDTEIYAAEGYYLELENSLDGYVGRVRSEYQGYDEYCYILDDIGHDPWELTALLTVQLGDYTLSDAEGMMDAIFNEQYEFSTTTVTETRYRTEKRQAYYEQPVYDDEGNFTGFSVIPFWYEVEVPYDYYILEVTLTNRGIDRIADGILGYDSDMKELYGYLVETKGSREYLW